MPSRSSNIIIGTTTIAFCASLTLHALVAEVAIEQYTSADIHLPGFDRSSLGKSESDPLIVSIPSSQQPPVASVPPPPMPAAIHPPEPAPEPKPEPEPEADPEKKFEELLGRSDGTGNAIDDSPGDEPLTARKGSQNQAWLSRDPSGPAQERSDAAHSVSAQGNAGAASVVESSPPAQRVEPREAQEAKEAIEASVEQPEMRAIPFGVGMLGERWNDVPIDRPATFAREAQRAQPAQEAVAAVEQVNASESSEKPVAEQLGKPGAPGAPHEPADPAPQAETESDPFRVLGGAQFRPGGTKAQLGRAHRLIAPRIGLSGMVDGVQIGRVRVVLQLTIDDTGNVTTANVFKSSGSESIDQACRTVAYRWWFEPKKGKDGNVLRSETFLFLVTFS